ncbi:PucR family transcriptional regulator [Chengkuizengella axinellae]|uniref:Helix-turn-helix domain-containing protein n=1 Tax=Chengkuizengella axinellae TaxID=3064388 RepID=A0ABT9J2H0_9BACL|nr:helix-turn-helix domain-containing protein [Chengkuizengella sp. 2205SS18-9]MDP5275809.1 helix-turn-helix domain-containing protein [Chengkuizengella sp. 2205SS18-9]
MNWDEMKIKLEQILNVQIQLEILHNIDWFMDRNVVVKNNRIYYFLYFEDHSYFTYAIEEATLTNTEKSLIGMTIDANRASHSQLAPEYKQQTALSLRDWIMQQLQLDLDHEHMPLPLLNIPQLSNHNIPILIQTDIADKNIGGDDELLKLLESFYDTKVIFVPLSEKEYLLLCSVELLEEEIEGQGKDLELEIEELLVAFSSSLHEMLISEWVGKCHVSVHYPIVPSESVLFTIKQLREIMELGRNYYINEYVYTPWNLYLEALLDVLPDDSKKHFIQRVFKQVDFVFDPEMKTTLEQFFNTGCNISETAKKLYIHRNTLNYRLDKFKQETGLDVRVFNQAILVKVSLLLYKVTNET